MSLDNYTGKSELLNGLRHSEAVNGREFNGGSPLRGYALLFCAVYPIPCFLIPLSHMWALTCYGLGISAVCLYKIKTICLPVCPEASKNNYSLLLV
jgi:hypothetical protein